MRNFNLASEVSHRMSRDTHLTCANNLTEISNPLYDSDISGIVPMTVYIEFLYISGCAPVRYNWAAQSESSSITVAL